MPTTRRSGDEGGQHVLRSEHRLVLQNYIENKEKYMGSGNYNEEGFAFMEKAVPTLGPIFKRALKAGVKMPMGTDAVAGAHGQNAREIIARVAAGRTKADGSDRRRHVARRRVAGARRRYRQRYAGYEADIIAVAGNPTPGHRGLRNVTFVMKGGKVVFFFWGIPRSSGPSRYHDARTAQRNFAAGARRFASGSSFVERMTSSATAA